MLEMRQPMTRFVTILVALGLALPAYAAEPEQGPRERIAERYQAIEKIVREAESNDTMREQIRPAMDAFVDYEMFGKLAAKSFWDAMNKKQREEFLELFKRLIQRTYLKRFKAKTEFEITLEDEAEFNTKRTKALISSTITSGKVTAEVVYKLYVPEGKSSWWAYDVVIDDVSVMRNYRTSFVKTWKKGGYDLLISKMRKKLDKVEQGQEDDDEPVGDLD